MTPEVPFHPACCYWGQFLCILGASGSPCGSGVCVCECEGNGAGLGRWLFTEPGAVLVTVWKPLHAAARAGDTGRRTGLPARCYSKHLSELVPKACQSVSVPHGPCRYRRLEERNTELKGGKGENAGRHLGKRKQTRYLVQYLLSSPASVHFIWCIIFLRCTAFLTAAS